MSSSSEVRPQSRPLLMAVAWAWVFLPFAYGFYQLVGKVTQLFTG